MDRIMRLDRQDVHEFHSRISNRIESHYDSVFEMLTKLYRDAKDDETRERFHKMEDELNRLREVIYFAWIAAVDSPLYSERFKVFMELDSYKDEQKWLNGLMELHKYTLD